MTERPKSSRDPASAKEPIVFVIDDDLSMRRALTNLFESVGLRVEVLGAAPELLRSELPDVARVLDQNLCMSLGSSFHAARFALSYHVLTARSAARMDLAIGTSASTGSGEIIANPVRSERL